MRLAGFFLMASGWIIVLAAVAVLPAGGGRALFALAGAAVEILGLILAFRAHAVAGGGER